MMRLHVEQYGPDDYRGRMEMGPAASFDLRAVTWPEMLSEIRMAYHVLVGSDVAATDEPAAPETPPAAPAERMVPRRRK